MTIFNYMSFPPFAVGSQICHIFFSFFVVEESLSSFKGKIVDRTRPRKEPNNVVCHFQIYISNNFFYYLNILHVASKYHKQYPSQELESIKTLFEVQQVSVSRFFLGIYTWSFFCENVNNSNYCWHVRRVYTFCWSSTAPIFTKQCSILQKEHTLASLFEKLGN